MRGIYLPSDTATAQGMLMTQDGLFSAELFRRWWLPPNQELVWNCWLKTLNHEPSLHFTLKGTYRDEQGDPLPPDHVLEDRFSIRGNLLFWNEDQGNFGINIRPNKTALRRFSPFFVEIKGNLVSPKAGAFWEVEAVRKGKDLILVEAQELFPPFKKKKDKRKGRTSSKGQKESQEKRETLQANEERKTPPNS